IESALNTMASASTVRAHHRRAREPEPGKVTRSIRDVSTVGFVLMTGAQPLRLTGAARPGTLAAERGAEPRPLPRVLLAVLGIRAFAWRPCHDRSACWSSAVPARDGRGEGGNNGYDWLRRLREGRRLAVLRLRRPRDRRVLQCRPRHHDDR